MGFGIIATLGAGLGAAVIGSKSSSKAADAQVQAAESGNAAQLQMFQEVLKQLQPYNDAGQSSLGSMLAMVGLGGEGEYGAIVDDVKNSPEYAARLEASEDAILANASATGGLRGGRTQLAIAENSSQLLSQELDKRYSRLGGITQIGQASAAQTGSQAIQTGRGIANGYAQIGSAQAGNAQAQGNIWGGLIGDVASYAAGGF